MSASALVCLAPGSEETEAVTTIDLLVRGGIKVTTASVASDGNLAITCSRGVKLLADAPLVEVADGEYDVIVLPGGIKGAECIPAEQWQDKRVVWDARVKLLTSQGPGTAIDFGLKIIDLLVGREKAHEVASQLVMAAGIYNYYE
ncbi:DJ-1/PfpI family protein [Shigella sonnei]|uniref:DJ-1/PfpI family protein n=1 Tax=Shigella sonnei TaxID=624 RepID=UPI000972EBD8|nr:DJ-1/PfpI family protein [Shigella sonnei]SJF27191.1 DJ-1 family protein [Shigella sonnei]